MNILFVEVMDRCCDAQNHVSAKGLLAVDTDRSLVEWNLASLLQGAYLMLHSLSVNEYSNKLKSFDCHILNTGLSTHVVSNRDVIAKSIQVFGMIHEFPIDKDLLVITSDYFHDHAVGGFQVKESYVLSDSSDRICQIGICARDLGLLWQVMQGRNDLRWKDLDPVLSSCLVESLKACSKSDLWAKISNQEQYKDFIKEYPISKKVDCKESVIVKSYARVGLMGNPSDGYNGKTISLLIKNFYAQISIIPHLESTNTEIVLGDTVTFSCFASLLSSIKENGYDGITRLLLATLKVFFSFTESQEKHKHGFTIYTQTDIPRQVGLSGSSAIVTGLLKALILYYNIDIPLVIQANLALSVEQDELGITAGLQDRVIQVYGGLLYMDFSKEIMMKQGYGVYEPINLDKLPDLWIAYCSKPKDSGQVHSNVRQRFLDQDPVVLAAMEQFASFANQAKQDLLKGDFMHFASLMNKNFDTRRSLYGDDVIGDTNLRLIDIARSHHMAAKFCGSGGCIVGMYCGAMESQEAETWKLRRELSRQGFIFSPIIT